MCWFLTTISFPFCKHNILENIWHVLAPYNWWAKHIETKTKWLPFCRLLRFIFMNENDCILIQISLKFVPLGPTNTKQALVRIMTWHRTGDKPFSKCGLNLIPAWMSNTSSLTYPSPYFTSVAGEVWKTICNFIPHFTELVISYPYLDLSYSMWLK